MYERILDLESQRDDLNYGVEALKQTASKNELRMQDLEDGARELRIQVGTVVTSTAMSHDSEPDTK